MRLHTHRESRSRFKAWCRDKESRVMEPGRGLREASKMGKRQGGWGGAMVDGCGRGGFGWEKRRRRRGGGDRLVF